MTYTRKNTGTCARTTTVTIENGVVNDIQIEGGCNGNIKGVISLCKGQKVDEVIAKLKGIKCGLKNTSCPDQLAKALEEAKEQ